MESASLTESEIAARVHALLPSQLRFHKLNRALQTNKWAERPYFTASLEPFARSNRLLFEAMKTSALERAKDCDKMRSCFNGLEDAFDCFDDPDDAIQEQFAVEDLYRESQAFREFHRHIGTFVTKCFDVKGPLPPAEHASCLKDKAVLMAMHRALHF